MHLPLTLPSHISSLLSFLESNTKKQREHVTQKWKQVYVGMEPSKTNQTKWEWKHKSFLHHVPFCQICTPQNSLHALSLFTPTKWTLYTQPAHSTAFYIKGNLYLPSSAKKFHNLTYHTDPARALHVQFLHSRQTISAMLSIATTLQLPTTYLTPHAHQHALHTQHYPPHCLPQPSYARN